MLDDTGHLIESIIVFVEVQILGLFQGFQLFFVQLFFSREFGPDFSILLQIRHEVGLPLINVHTELFEREHLLRPPIAHLRHDIWLLELIHQVIVCVGVFHFLCQFLLFHSILVVFSLPTRPHIPKEQTVYIVLADPALLMLVDHSPLARAGDVHPVAQVAGEDEFGVVVRGCQFGQPAFV